MGTSYLVYLLKAPPSERQYLGWTCGGAIVSPDYIITSAACVEDVKHMYAIAGYKKFVDADKIETDTCTRSFKKKIVFTCVPKAYDLEFTRIEKWSYSDIALAKVESPYTFDDEEFKTTCSYIPAIIPINYEQKYQEVGTDCIVMGWGHNEIWRGMSDVKSYNSKEIKYASTEILSKSVCKKEYKADPETEENKALLAIIDKYMICTFNAGNINDKGELLMKSKPEMEGCLSKAEKLLGAEGDTCEESDKSVEEIIEEEYVEEEEELPEEIVDQEEATTTEAQEAETTQTNESPKETTKETAVPEESDEEYIELDDVKGEIVVIDKRKNNIYESLFQTSNLTRRNGICQNDHGSPLVTWVGGHKVLIGVASVFKITATSKCAGPYLFTSSQCNGKFIDCILNPDENSPDSQTKALRLRRKCHSSPQERGFDMIERRISWINHPAGPAENERYEIRPQIPISEYLLGLGRK